MTGSARPLLGAVRDALNTDSKLDARWLVGLAAGLDQPVMGHQNITLTPDQESSGWKDWSNSVMTGCR